MRRPSGDQAMLSGLSGSPVMRAVSPLARQRDSPNFHARLLVLGRHQSRTAARHKAPPPRISTNGRSVSGALWLFDLALGLCLGLLDLLAPGCLGRGGDDLEVRGIVLDAD